MGVLFSRNTSSNGSSGYAAGKNVLITGASAGIGAELARKFAEQGANLALVARNQTNLEAVAKECLALGAIQAGVFPCDLTKDEDTQTAIQTAIESFGDGKGIDIVVLNAGRSMGCYFEEIRGMESINYMLKLNVNGVIHALMCALPAMPKSEASRIVIVSSVAGLVGVPYRTVYCASKHALAGFANALRIELKDTYGGSANGAPRVQLINFPEVQGTNLNSGRMDMGAVRPPIEFKTGAGVVATVEEACLDLMVEIEKGTDEWGQKSKGHILVLLRLFFATLADFLILTAVKKTHIRPDKIEPPDAAPNVSKKSQ
jgi:NADP-dependent 3-hydroxy acid dehydrogenase YdfG